MEQTIYGLIGKMVAAPQQRDPLIELILEGAESMPGCLSYVVAKDAANPDAIWITEVWDRKESHEASISLPQAQASIQKAMPLVAGFEAGIETEPIGGTSLQATIEREASRGLARMGGGDPDAEAPLRRRTDPEY